MKMDRRLAVLESKTGAPTEPPRVIWFTVDPDRQVTSAITGWPGDVVEVRRQPGEALQAFKERLCSLPQAN